MSESVLQRFSGFMLEETTDEEGGISVADIRDRFKGARYGVKLKHSKSSKEAVREAVRKVFGCDCDEDDVYPNLKFRSLASHAASASVLAVMPHNGVQDTFFAKGFNLQGGFLANLPILTEMQSEDHYYARVVVTKTAKGLEVMFLVSTEQQRCFMIS